MAFSFPALKVVETGSKRLMSTAANVVRPASPRTPRTPRSITEMLFPKSPSSTPSAIMSPRDSTPRSMSFATQASMNQVNRASPAQARNPASFAFPAAEPAASLSPAQKTYLDHLEGMRRQKAANFPKLKTSPRGAGRPLSAPGRVMGSGNPTTRSLAAHIGGIVKSATNKPKPQRKNSQALTQRRRKSVAAHSRSGRSFAAGSEAPEDRFRYLDHLEELREKDFRAAGADYKNILGKMRALSSC